MKDLLANRNTPEYEAVAQEIRSLFHGNSMTDAHKLQAVAEIITPILLNRLYIEDIWAQILKEQDWTGIPVQERKFRIPTELVGADKVLTYQNGMTFPQFTVNRRQVTVSPEEIATPEFVIDNRELRRIDPVVTIADVETFIRRMLLIHKARRGYELLTHGFDDNTSNLTVLIDDGTYDSFGQLAILKTLRDTVEETSQNLIAFLGGNPRLSLVAEALTLARLKRSGLSAAWTARVGGDAQFPNPGQVVYGPTTEFPIDPYAFPSATDDVNGFPNRGRKIITPGDLLLIGPDVAAVALTEPLEPSVLQTTHYNTAYAWRAGYAYVRWSDIGDTTRMARLLYMRRVGVNNEPRAVLTLDGLSSDGINLFSTRPIDKHTLDNTTVKVAATAGGAVVTGALTPVMKGNLREFRATFATPLTAGTTYFVQVTTGLHDLAGDTVTALAEIQVKCG